MNKLESSKYMELFTTVGYFVGFGIILWYVLFQTNPLLVVAGVIIIFVFRIIGYGIDRIIELKAQK
jgi:hypothetical protein